jgi:NAD(P)-dependent dehydrogenase (short-subunit alcohol dehydrogenase family)
VGADLTGKIALITGVGRPGQIGHAVAAACGAAGAALVIADRDAGALAARRAELEAAGVRVRAVTGDLTQPAAARAAVAAATGELGGLDAVVNLAGGLTTAGSFLEIAPDALDRELAINLKTTWHVCQAAIPALSARGGGAIVNVASVALLRPAAHLAAYAAAKAAVAALTQTLAREFLAQGVRVNAVAPAAVRTSDNVAQMGASPASPYVEMDEVVRVILFLASDASRGVTGQVLPVTGKTA